MPVVAGRLVWFPIRLASIAVKIWTYQGTNLHCSLLQKKPEPLKQQAVKN